MTARPGQPCPELPFEIWGHISDYFYPWEWAITCAPVCRALRAMPVSMLHIEACKGSACAGKPAGFSPPLSWLSGAWQRLQSLSLGRVSSKHAQLLEAAFTGFAAAQRLTTLRIGHWDAQDALLLSRLLAVAQACMPSLRQLFIAVLIAPVMPTFERLQHLHMQAAVYDDVTVMSLLHMPELKTLCLESLRLDGPQSVPAQMGTLDLQTLQQLQHLSLLRVEPGRVLVVESCRVHVTFPPATVLSGSWARIGAHHFTVDCMSAASDQLSEITEGMQQAVFAGSLQSFSVVAERLGSPSLPFLVKGPVFSQVTSLTLRTQCALVVTIPSCMPLERLLIAAPNLSLAFEDLRSFAGRVHHLGVWMHDIECLPLFEEMHGLLLARGLQLVYGENLRWSSHAYIHGCDYDFEITGLWPVGQFLCDCTACWSCLKRRGIVGVNNYGVG